MMEPVLRPLSLELPEVFVWEGTALGGAALAVT